MAGSTVPSGKGSTSIIKILSNIFISFIGAGVLGLPFAFKQAGIIEGALVMAFVSYLSTRAMLLIVDCKYTILERRQSIEHSTLLSNDESSSDDVSLSKRIISQSEFNVWGCRYNLPFYPGEWLFYHVFIVGWHAMGNLGRKLVDISLLISQIGFCCGYLIFITQNLTSYFPSVHKDLWLVALVPALFMLTLYRELERLAHFSLFAQISNLVAFGVVFWFDFEHIHVAKRLHPKEFSLIGFPFFFAVAVYCYEGAGMVLALEGSLAKGVRHKFKSYFVITIIFITSLYIAFGACGYLSFGSETDPIITLNLPQRDGVDAAKLVKMCLCISLFFTYPVMMFPVSETLQPILLQNVTPQSRTFYENVLRFIMVALTGLIVVMIPSFADLMALVGATCCTLLGFTLPGAFHFLLHKKLPPRKKLLDCVLIAIGVLGAILGTLDTLKRMSERTDLEKENIGKPQIVSPEPIRLTSTSPSTLSTLSKGLPSTLSKAVVDRTIKSAVTMQVTTLRPAELSTPMVETTPAKTIAPEATISPSNDPILNLTVETLSKNETEIESTNS